METATATVAGQMPGSGSSCYWDRPGSARQRAGGPCCATGETPACTAAIEEITGVKVDKTNKRINLITNKLEDVKEKN